MRSTDQTPNEKLIETLFNAAALRHLGSTASLYTPTSRQEFVAGYDACLNRPSDGRALFVQFKAIRQWSPDLWGTVRLSPAQHATLRRSCPPGTAYYVTTALKSVDDVHHAWRRAENSPLSFLRFYAAVCVTDLGYGAEEFAVRRRAISGRKDDLEPTDVSHPTPRTGGFRWVKGDELIRTFVLGGQPSNKVREAGLSWVFDDRGADMESDRDTYAGSLFGLSQAG